MIKHRIFLLSQLCLLLFVAAFSAKAQQKPYNQQIVIKLKKELPTTFSTAQAASEPSFRIGHHLIDSVSAANHAYASHSFELGKGSGRYAYIIHFTEATKLENVINAYYQTQAVEYAEPNYLAYHDGIESLSPNDENYNKQWAFKNDGTLNIGGATPRAGADIKMEEGWAIEKGSSNVVVAIIDTGTDLLHPELKERLWKNSKEIPGNNNDDDNNGYVDDIFGWDFTETDNNPSDVDGHGTHVAGTVGAIPDNRIGVAGVDWNCRLMTVKALSDLGSGSFEWIAQSIYYAADNGADVINMSLSGSSDGLLLQEAVNYAVIQKGVVVVVAMGNNNSSVARFPAACIGVIAVGSTDARDFRSDPFTVGSVRGGSNYGPHIWVVAPGSNIISLGVNSGMGRIISGTSMATPHVAGLVSLLLAQDPTRTPEDIRNILKFSSDDVVGRGDEDTRGFDIYHGYGRINARRALSFRLTAIPDVPISPDFRLFPNPSNNGRFTVRLPEKALKISVTNALGQLVLEKEVDGEASSVLNLSNSGLYLVRIHTMNQIYSQKVVVE
ncbi:MAG: T9SS C-terminal target domain-containing protein [Cytophagales bacterium]|nr:MAG: T9SS C-terminal target domain-containing protein [Cytophagales bacterium]